MDERDGQHIGVVTKALVNVVPPSSMIMRVLFITCSEPGRSKLKKILILLYLIINTKHLSFFEAVVRLGSSRFSQNLRFNSWKVKMQNSWKGFYYATLTARLAECYMVKVTTVRFPDRLWHTAVVLAQTRERLDCWVTLARNTLLLYTKSIFPGWPGLVMKNLHKNKYVS